MSEPPVENRSESIRKSYEAKTLMQIAKHIEDRDLFVRPNTTARSQEWVNWRKVYFLSDKDDPTGRISALPFAVCTICRVVIKVASKTGNKPIISHNKIHGSESNQQKITACLEPVSKRNFNKLCNNKFIQFHVLGGFYLI